MASNIPWCYSERLRREFVYVRSRDEIVFRDGTRIRRPTELPASSLAHAIYEGSLDFQYSGSPPDQNTGYVTRTGPVIGGDTNPSSRAPRSSSSRPIPIPGSSSAGDTAANDLSARLAAIRVNSPPSQPVAGPSSYRPPPPTTDDDVRDIRDPRGLVQNLMRAGPKRTTELLEARTLGADTEKLFPSYKQRHRTFFFVGKVFSVLWAEPTSSATTVFTSVEEGISVGSLGQKVHSKIRRFVVIRAGENYCNALPISTYNRRGVSAPGKTKSEHAVIYTNPMPSILNSERPTRGEEGMRPIPIRVDPDSREEKLDTMSRLNFGHPHTIHHNIAVKSCGKVADDSKDDLLSQFADVFGLLQVVSVRTPSAPSSRPTAESSSSRSRETDTDDRSDDSLARVRRAIRAFAAEGYEGEEAVRKTARTLTDRGLSQTQAAELIRKALSAG